MNSRRNPKRDGSGKGIGANKGRGGCKTPKFLRLGRRSNGRQA